MTFGLFSVIVFVADIVSGVLELKQVDLKQNHMGRSCCNRASHILGLKFILGKMF